MLHFLECCTLFLTLLRSTGLFPISVLVAGSLLLNMNGAAYVMQGGATTVTMIYHCSSLW